jgi:hypothetical protein
MRVNPANRYFIGLLSRLQHMRLLRLQKVTAKPS